MGTCSKGMFAWKVCELLWQLHKTPITNNQVKSDEKIGGNCLCRHTAVMSSAFMLAFFFFSTWITVPLNFSMLKVEFSKLTEIQLTGNFSTVHPHSAPEYAQTGFKYPQDIIL